MYVANIIYEFGGDDATMYVIVDGAASEMF
jgi:hypothetical protein